MNAPGAATRATTRSWRGRDAARSRDGVDRPRRRDRRRTRDPPQRPLEGPDAIGADCVIHAGGAHDRLDDRRRRHRQALLRAPRLGGRERRDLWGRSAHLRPEVRTSARGAHRQLRRAEEDAARARAPRPTTWPTSATRRSAQREHRRRHDHLQLRRRAQAPDRDRRRRLHRHRLAAGRAGHGRRGRLRRRRLRRSPRTSRRARSRSAARATGTNKTAGGGASGKAAKHREGAATAAIRGRANTHVRHRRLHRRQERRRHHRRRAKRPRVSRLRLGRRRRARRRRASSAAAAPASCRASKTCWTPPGRRRLRHRPHALGDARPAHRGERAPAPRLHAAASSSSTTGSSRTTSSSSASCSRKATSSTETDTEVVAHLIEHELKATAPRIAVRGRCWRACAACSRSCVMSAGRPREDRRRPQRAADRGRPRRRRDVRGLRHPGDPQPHARRRLPRGRRDGRGHPRRRRFTDFDGRPRGRKPQRARGTRSWPRRAATSTSCSRRSTSSRGRSATPCAGASRSRPGPSSSTRWNLAARTCAASSAS